MGDNIEVYVKRYGDDSECYQRVSGLMVINNGVNQPMLQHKSPKGLECGTLTGPFYIKEASETKKRDAWLQIEYKEALKLVSKEHADA